MDSNTGKKDIKPRTIGLDDKFDEDFLSKMDGRCTAVRTLKVRYGFLTADLGGFDQLSYQQLSLCKRVIHIESKIESWEKQLVDGEPIDLNKYINCTNTLIALLKNLGLERKKPPIKTLQEYIEADK